MINFFFFFLVASKYGMPEDHIYLNSQPLQVFYWESGMCAYMLSGGQERDADGRVFHRDSVTSSGTEMDTLFLPFTHRLK